MGGSYDDYMDAWEMRDYGGKAADTPRIGHIPAKAEEPVATGAHTCQECHKFFDIVELVYNTGTETAPIGVADRYGGVLRHSVVLCSTCHLVYLARHSQLWRDVQEFTIVRADYPPDGRGPTETTPDGPPINREQYEGQTAAD